MITAQDLLAYVQAKPFRPFRLHVASGRTFDIRHPERIRVGANVALVFSFVGDSTDVFDKWETVGLFLIESISFLDAPVGQDGN